MRHQVTRTQEVAPTQAARELIPREVVHALEVVEAKLAEEVLDFDTMVTFVHLFGFDGREP